MPGKPAYLVDNAPIREAVLNACRTGEVSLSELSGELGYKRPCVSTLRRTLGMTKYVARHDANKQNMGIGMSLDNAKIIFDLVAPEGERQEDWLIPVGPQYTRRKSKVRFTGKTQGQAEWRYGMFPVWGNGMPMVYAWRIRVLVERAVREGRITLAELARALGYVKNDSAPLKRMLGMKASCGGQARTRYFQTRMDEQTALKLCYRLGYDPVDWGI